MAKSNVIVSFSGTMFDGNYLGLGNDLAVYGDGPRESFVEVRSGPNETTIGISAHITANNYYQALIADYGNGGLYTFVINGNDVIITSTLSNAVFSVQTLVGAGISVVINNEVEEIPITIDSILFGVNVANKCGSVLVIVETNVLATKYYVDGVEYANTENPFSYVLNKGVNKFLEVQASNLTTANQYVRTPDPISEANTIITIDNTPNGANVTIDLVLTYLVVAEYSLDSVNWKTSNVFNSLTPGNYTAYVLDAYGCLVAKPFTVEQFEPVTTTDCSFSYLSKAMSIRFKRNQEWDFNDIFKTNDNTLSCEEEVDIAYQCIQQFKPTNLVTTQFLSNYKNISANVIKEDGTKTALAIETKTQFLDIKDKRDCQLYGLNDGANSGVYYTSGNTYDYTTGIDNGSYALNGQLPEYGVIGNAIEIIGVGWFTIKDIFYNETLNADVLVIEYNYIGSSHNEIVGCQYNQQPFNVYEFKVDFALYNNQKIQIEILQSMEGFDDYNYLSEILEVSDYWKDSVELIWYNTSDGDVFYSTGIRNIGNLLYESFAPSNDSSLNINKTPNTAIIVDSSNYELRKLLFEPITTGILSQLVQAVLHKELYVNRVKYISNDAPEVDSISNTNLSSLSSTLLLLGRPYTSQSEHA